LPTRIRKEALKLREKGYTIDEIADILNLQRDTVVWLLMKEAEEKMKPIDVYVNWFNIYSSPRRLKMMAEMLVDLIKENIKEDIDIICGIGDKSLPLALEVSSKLNAKMALLSIKSKEGKTLEAIVDPGYAQLEKGKNIVLVEDIVRTGAYLEAALETLRKYDSNILAIVVPISKLGRKVFSGVPVLSLIDLIPL